MIDAHGRAYRYMPHQREPAWVGTGTIAQGAGAILDIGVPCRLIELASPEPSSPAAAVGDTVDESATPLHEEPDIAPETSVPVSPVQAVADVGFAQSR